MIVPGFAFGGIALVGLSLFMTRNTSPFSSCGGSDYEKRRLRWLAGKLLLIAGLMSLGIAMMAEYVGSLR
jgi:hypothetical protein